MTNHLSVREICSEFNISRGELYRYRKGLRKVGFPEPVAETPGGRPLWRWEDVWQWHALRLPPGRPKGSLDKASRKRKRDRDD